MATLDDIAALLQQQNELLQKFLLTSTMPVLPEPTRSKDKSENEQRAEAAYQRMLKRRSK